MIHSCAVSLKPAAYLQTFVLTSIQSLTHWWCIHCFIWFWCLRYVTRSLLDINDNLPSVLLLMLLRLWIHSPIYSWNQPPLTYEGKLSCLKKQRKRLTGFELTTYREQMRRATHCATPSLMYTLYGTGLVYWSCIWSKKTDLKCLNDVAHVITFRAVNTNIKSVQFVYFKW